MSRELVIAGAMLVAAWFLARNIRKDEFTVAVTAADPVKVYKDTSPWTEKLSAVTDSPVSAPAGARQPVAHTETEIRDLANKIVERIDAHTAAKAVLLDVDQVRKTVDSYKTLEYEMIMTIYSQASDAALKLFVQVRVPTDNSIHITTLRMYTSLPQDVPGPAGSRGPKYEESYASFTPLMQY